MQIVRRPRHRGSNRVDTIASNSNRCGDRAGVQGRAYGLDEAKHEYILVYMATIAKLFINGGSQAVRLPKEFRFEGEEVSVRRLGRGVVLEPVVPSAWPSGYWARMPRIDDSEWQRPNDAPPAPIEEERELP